MKYKTQYISCTLLFTVLTALPSFSEYILYAVRHGNISLVIAKRQE